MEVRLAPRPRPRVLGRKPVMDWVGEVVEGSRSGLGLRGGGQLLLPRSQDSGAPVGSGI